MRQLILAPHCLAKLFDQVHLLDGAAVDVSLFRTDVQQGQAAGAGDDDFGFLTLKLGNRVHPRARRELALQ